MSDIENLVGELRLSGNRLMQRAADALEAQTGVRVDMSSAVGVEAQLEVARQPTEDGREALDKIVTEYDLALYTKEETLDRLSRAAVPDAATEAKQPEGWSTEDRRDALAQAATRWGERAGDPSTADYAAGAVTGFALGAEWQKARETFISYRVIADEARAERDAALAAVERVLAVLAEERAWLEHLVESGDAMSRNVVGIGKVEAALDWAPEPEWEYGREYRDEAGDPHVRVSSDVSSPDGHRADGSPYWNYRVMRRRKAGPWLPIEKEQSND